MPSPFPGMDPYIESSDRWGDFHTNMVSAIRAQLNARLPKRYTASVEEYVWVAEPKARRGSRRVEPDVYVTERAGRSKPPEGTPAAAGPTMIELAPLEVTRRRYVRIVDRESERVITAIELLSPGNKEVGALRRAYLRKRDEYLLGRVNLVEMDLLRGGERLPLGDPPPNVPDYYVMICRVWEYPQAGLWPVSIRDSLPEIPVPLARNVAPVPLALRPCLDRVYEESKYAAELHYGRLLTPRLGKRDAAWAREILAARPPAEIA
jgi:hypothetical protein